MKTKWAKRTAEVIRSGEVPEGVIRSMRQIMARAINKGVNSWMTGTPSCTYEDAGQLLDMVCEFAPSVSAEQARKGADWLYSQAFTPRGNVRQTEWARGLRESDLQIIRECHANPRFRLVELDECWNRSWLILSPVYRCYGTGGKYFDYIARAWQSGGNSYIANRGQE